MSERGLPLLPTAVVGSYAVPEWLERVKNDYFQRRISRDYLEQIHDVCIKAALKDQEVAGIDVVTDGELRRDNMVDYLAARLPGVEIDQKAKSYYYDYYQAYVRHPIPRGPLHLVEDYRFTARWTDRAVKFTLAGPHLLAKRLRNEWYRSERELALDLARVLNEELHRLEEAGLRYAQIDEPYVLGFPEDLEWAIDAWNATRAGLRLHVALHICYGNRYGKPSWEGSYRALFPAILRAEVQQLVFEFARRGYADLELFGEYPARVELGLGVIDVKSQEVETPELVAARAEAALAMVPAERLWLLPDCGLSHLPQEVAFAKLRALAEGAALARAGLARRTAVH